jgi:hypothetical protein
MDWIAKLYTAVQDAVIDHDRPFATELRLVAVADFAYEEISTVLNLGLDCFICPDSVWYSDD